MNKLNMEENHWLIVKKILEKYPYTFYAFGSRTKGNPRRFSDLDLCFEEKIPLNIQSHIDEDFEESDLPYKVDVIDLNQCDETFRRNIEKDLVLVQDLRRKNGSANKEYIFSKER